MNCLVLKSSVYKALVKVQRLKFINDHVPSSFRNEISSALSNCYLKLCSLYLHYIYVFLHEKLMENNSTYESENLRTCQEMSEAFNRIFND